MYMLTASITGFCKGGKARIAVAPGVRQDEGNPIGIVPHVQHQFRDFDR